MIYLEDASKKQLLQIALYEPCDIDLKYAACRELELRKWKDEMLTDLVSLNAQGKSVFDISIELGIDQYIVRKKMQEYGIKRKVQLERKKKRERSRTKNNQPSSKARL